MPSPAFSFNFGPTTTEFGSAQPQEGWESATHSEWMPAKDDRALLRDEKDALTREVRDVRQQLDDAVRAKKLAEQRAETAMSCFQTRDKDYKRFRTIAESLKGNMDEAIYREIAELHEELEGLRGDNKHLRQQVSNLQDEAKQKDQDLHALELQLTGKDTALDNLRELLQKSKDDLDHQKSTKEAIDQQLQETYAQINGKEAEQKLAAKEKDDALNALKATEEQLKELQEELQQRQGKIEELESRLNDVEDLDSQNAALETDLEGLREELEERNRTLIIKDERISQLEQQYQKATLGKMNAEAAAANAAVGSPIEEPQIINTAGDSLAAELADVSDYEESIYEQLDYSRILNITEIAPVEPAKAPELSIRVVEAANKAPLDVAIPKLSVGIIKAANVDPINVATPRLTVDVTEATVVDPINVTPPSLTVRVTEAAGVAPVERKVATATSSAQTTTPKLTASLIESATINLPPIEPWEIVTKSSTTQTDAAPKQTTLGTQTDKETTPEQPKLQKTPVTVTHDQPPLKYAAPTKTTAVAIGTQTTETTEQPKQIMPVLVNPKKPLSKIILMYLVPFLFALLAYWCMTLWSELHMWQTANGTAYCRGGYSMYNRAGAFGNPRKLLGFIPVATDVGGGWWSEQIARGASRAISRYEDWAGTTPTPVF